MSGVIIVLGDLAGSSAAIERGRAASPGRGEITADCQDQHCHLAYQGDCAAREFYCGADWICCALGWPYEMRAGEGNALSAEAIAWRFGETQVLDRSKIFGQYLIVLYCRRNARLWVLRDALGSLPLHWARNATRSVHASDIRQVCAALAQKRVLRVAALRQYHQSLSLPNEVALYHNVQQHLPGELSVCSASDVQPQVLAGMPNLTELVPSFSTKLNSADELSTASVLSAVRTSLRMCVQDRAFALSLSGGMDSTLLALTAMNAGFGARITGIACIFPDRVCDESVPIRALVNRIGLSHELIPLTEPHFDHWQNELFSGSDYVPFPANQIVLNVAKRAAAKGISILIDGNGGDELFDWSILELAQCVRSFPGALQLLRAAWRAPEGTNLAAGKRLLGQLLRRRWSNPGSEMQALVQKMVSASRTRAFYLAREQLCANERVQVFSPLRDTRLLQLFAPFLPSASFRGGIRRGLQTQCIAQLSAGGVQLQRSAKVSFNDLTLLCDADSAKTKSAATPHPAFEESTLALPELGPPKFEHYAQLLPRFFRHKVNTEQLGWTD